MSYEDTETLTSPIGDHVPPTGRYRGYHTHVTMAGYIVARAQEIVVNVNNNFDSYGELGTRHLKWQPGPLEIRGSLRQFTFDTLKLRLAMGNSHHIVSGASYGGYLSTVSSDTPISPDSSPGFGTQPWLMPWRFAITVEVHSDATGEYMEFKMDDVQIDTWRLQSVREGDVVENMTFVAEKIGGKILSV